MSIPPTLGITGHDQDEHHLLLTPSHDHDKHAEGDDHPDHHEHCGPRHPTSPTWIGFPSSSATSIAAPSVDGGATSVVSKVRLKRRSL